MSNNMSDRNEFHKCNFCKWTNCLYKQRGVCETVRFRPDTDKIVDTARSKRISVSDIIALLKLVNGDNI